MKSKVGHVFLVSFIIINALVVLAMIVSAYSSFLPPQNYPNWSYLGLFFPVFLVLTILFVPFWLVVNFRYVFIPLLGLLSCYWAVRAYFPINLPCELSHPTVKVMSYNTMMFGNVSKVKWEGNPVAEYINASGADIVCLQEVGGLKDAMDKGLVRFDDYPYCVLDSNKRDGLACLSKYPILSSKKIDYYSRGKNCSYAYEILIGIDTVLLVNNHFESYRLSAEDKQQYKDLIKNADEIDVEGNYDALTSKLVASNKIKGLQVDAVASFIDENVDIYDYVIVCGDFNDSPISYAHHRFSKHLDDAFTVAGNGLGFSYRHSGMFFRLDHILVSESVKVYDSYVDGDVDASDHQPIYCVFNLQ